MGVAESVGEIWVGRDGGGEVNGGEGVEAATTVVPSKGALRGGDNSG